MKCSFAIFASKWYTIMLSEFVRSFTKGVIKNTLISQRTEINLASDKFGVSLVVWHVYINVSSGQ